MNNNLGFVFLFTINGSTNQLMIKNELILWKLTSIQTKIFNDIEYNLNLTQINSIEFEF
jgi:hypothetical protein